MSQATETQTNGEATAAKVLATAGLAAVLATRAEAQESSPNGSEVAASWTSPLKRLVRRTTYGLSPVELQRATRLGFDGYLQAQLAGNLAMNVDFEKSVVDLFPRTAWDVADLWNVADDWTSTAHLQMAGIMRACFSPYQLQERMVEFWFDHFNVFRGATLGRLLVPYVRDTIRVHALGKFHHLLSAVAHSPAMLIYLTNDENEATRSNVNFARELFELHTLGVDAGYTNEDLRQTALIFTGWKFYRDAADPKRGQFRFYAPHHQPGDKVVMGTTFQNGGQQEGENMIAYLADHSATAKHITKKLVIWFLGPTLNTSAWRAAEDVFVRTGGEIREVLKVILTPENLMAADPKYKRPFHLVASGIRALMSEVTRYDYLKDFHVKVGGHAQYEWYAPDGYPDRFEYWAHSMAPRFGYACSMGNNSIVGVTSPIDSVFGAVRTPDAVYNVIHSLVFANEMSSGDRICLLGLLNRGSIDRDRLRAAMAFAVACPSFQWY